MIKSGFGNVRQLFTTGAGNDRNAIIQLPGGNQQLSTRIRGIFYSYGVDIGNTSTFSQGRIALVNGLFSDSTLAIAPDSPLSMASILGGNFSAIFDHMLTRQQDSILFGDSGYLIPNGADVTLILTAPLTSGDVQPAFDNMQGSLTVWGEVGGLKDAYGKLR